MEDYEPIEIRGYYRSHTHLPIWEVMEQAGFWRQLAIRASFEYCDSSAAAEAALFDGTIDFISGNHITPYAKVARGQPICSLTSPSNSVRDSLVARDPIASLAELRGRRVADTTVLDRGGGYNHIRGNHMLYLLRAGLGLDEVRWVEIADMMSEEFRRAQIEALRRGEADVTFVSGGAAKYAEEGFHVLALGPLPMISGPTLTTTMTALRRRDRLGERLVKAQLLGIHFARTRQQETEEILAGLKRRVPETAGVSYRSVAKLLARPYPDHRAVGNAYELCCMKAPEAEEMSPLALWDLHYLRDLDQSGFIDRLYGTPQR